VSVSVAPNFCCASGVVQTVLFKGYTKNRWSFAGKDIPRFLDLLLDRPEAVDALEQIILHLAVRGLLVPQDPTDDAVDSLLEQVRTQKEELVAEGKAKRGKSVLAIEERRRRLHCLQDGSGSAWVNC
jgi:hypothetical protein